MSDCEHTFDAWDLWPGDDYPPIYNGMDGEVANGLPQRLEARVRCRRCSEEVVVSYVIEGNA